MFGLTRERITAWQLGLAVNEQPPNRWQSVQVPACWETQGVPITYTDPVWYRTVVTMPKRETWQHVWLHCGGVSHRCSVWVNGCEIGNHQGIWDAFAVDLTSATQPGQPAELRLKVSKPVGRDAIRSTLTGFLPYVWGNAFGGPWQPITLRTSGPVVIDDVWVEGNATGTVTVRYEVAPAGNLAHPGMDGDQTVSGCKLLWRMHDAKGSRVAAGEAAVPATGVGAFTFDIATPQLWHLHNPYLYELHVDLVDCNSLISDVWRGRVGLRNLSIDGSRILLNGEPIYPRGVLNWGWHPTRITPYLTRTEIATELDQVGTLGFNMMKHCLYVPVPDYWEECDRRGMLGWLEMPLWLPKVDAAFQEQVLSEYARIYRQVRNHPSLAIITLGCELSHEAGPAFLAHLYQQAKEMTHLPLIRDNSGSAECYGGNTVEFADFYDYHFYCEPHYFDALNAFFAPRWQAQQPTLFGEYLDTDTFRDLRTLADHHGNLPWWTKDDPQVNPQGVRWEYNVVHQLERLAAAGLMERSPDIVDISYKQSMAMRKVVLEKTRATVGISGYVITALCDQPISTAGVIADQGNLKFDPAQMQAVNADNVLLLGWDRRRSWLNGGDRPRNTDHYNYWSESSFRAHLVLAVGSGTALEVQAEWRLEDQHGHKLAAGTCRGLSGPGGLSELGVIEATLPKVSQVTKLQLIVVGGRPEESGPPAARLANSWSFWVYPPVNEAVFNRVTVWDPVASFAQARAMWPPLRCANWLPAWSAPDWSALEPNRICLTTNWNSHIADWVAAGGKALVLHMSHGSLPVLGRPFWREAIKLIEPHPITNALAHGGYADIQFYGIAPEYALDTTAFCAALQQIGHTTRRTPIITRLDARNMEVTDYLASFAIGNGELLACTLNLNGGMGDQPPGLPHNVAGAYLLAHALEWLAES